MAKIALTKDGTVVSFWQGNLGSVIRGSYTAALAAGGIYLLNHLAGLHWPPGKQWEITAWITGIVRGLVDKPLRDWASKALIQYK